MPVNNRGKVAFYCRVGSAEQLTEKKITALYCRSAQACEPAVTSQEWQLREYAGNLGCDNLSCYTDNGASGTTLDRSALNRLMNDIRAGRIETVIAVNMARIARDVLLFHQFYTAAGKYGVRILTVQDGDAATFTTEFVEGIAEEIIGSYR
jgi:DNA invertase Pin-like site-specific DNA recombinase